MKITLKNTKTISAAGFLILIALIWFAGPFVGWGIEDCLKMISGVLVLWLATLLVGRVVAVRGGRLLEKMLRRQADAAVMEADAARRGEVKLLRERLLSAINTLKNSELGKTRGAAALYELPWYMIVGHPAAGKSTALLNSGLVFPFNEQVSIQGTGGTRNCDWFLTTEGVLLDTAGRYATQTENRDRDRGEWLEFLGLLKRYRSKAPVNGILVATSLPELINYNSEDFTAYVRRLRERIHEIEDIFGLRVPIYLIFTKLDLLGGFSQFFEDLDDAGRDRVWGATLPHEMEVGADIRREVERQCELLYQGVRQIGEEKLGLLHGEGGKPALFAFPLEFHAVKEGIGRLVELLHEEDPYHAKPLLRGFYFTSGLQKDEPLIAAAVRVSSQFGLSRGGFQATQPAASCGYFLRGLFREVLFPDQHLILRQTRPRINRLRFAGMLAGVAAVSFSIGLLTLSWIGNRNMLDAIGVGRAQARELIANVSLPDKLKGLTLLQKHLETLQHHRVDGTPWRVGMGLYQGRKLEAALRKQYFDGICSVMLAPIQDSLEGELRRVTVVAVLPAPAPAEGPQASRPRGVVPVSYRPAGNNQAPPGRPAPQSAPLPLEEGYEALKTYLMLASERSHLDAGYLQGRMERYWRPWLEARQGGAGMDGVEADARQLVAFYVSQLQAQAPDVPLIENKPPAVEDARLVLRSTANRPQAKELIYNGLRDSANARYPALSVARILDGKDGGIMAGTATVPGAYTREAYDKYMREAINRASRGEIKGDDWVLAVSVSDGPGKDGDENRNRDEIEALYRADYAKAWVQFLNGVVILAHPKDIAQAERMLERLANPQNSPIKVVLQRVAFETAWDNPAQLSNAVEGVRDTARTAAKWAGGQQIPNVNIPLENRYGILGRQFASLAAVSDSDKQGTPLLAGYLEHLGRLKGQLNPIAASDDQSGAALKLILSTLNGSGSEFAETMQYVDNTLLAAVGEQAMKDALRPLLAAPLKQSYKTLLPPVEETLEDAWQSEVHEQWVTLANKYPFSNSQNEVRPIEIIYFLGSGGTVDKFVEDYLKGLVVKRGGQFVPRTWADLGVRLNPQFMTIVGRMSSLGSAMSRSGGGAGESSRFELRPIPTPGIAEIIVEIDGQVLRYRNGPQPWQAFNWPGGDSQGARIQVVANNGVVSTVSSQPGNMGLMRMIGESTRKLDANMAAGQLEWHFKGPEGTQSVKLDFRATGGLNPMQLAGLGSVNLPRRITQQ
ncbi:MAG: type VI secretion system membrane subunit TssM [Betaproteobacteria bacterium]|nr:type VI secretion system membrane subunit TssM [Betaproteobacteria bacterium]